jgi:outer membrane immunogenic protein
MRATWKICALLCALVNPAAAGDLGPYRGSIKDAVSAPPPTWTGLYFGIHGGWGWGDADRALTPADGAFGDFPPNNSPSTDVDGGIIGWHSGYNWQFSPSWLVGLESTIAWSGLEGSVGPTAFGTAISTDTRWFATATTRLGYTSSKYLYYIKGGLAGAKVETSIFNPFPAAFSGKNSFLGWTVGGGIEVLCTPNWVFGVEYNYYDLGTEGIGGMYSNGEAVAQNVDLQFSSILARLSYKY